MADQPSLRERWLKMKPEERAGLEPSGRSCVDCGKPAGTPWGPYWCPDCDDRRMARIDASLKQLGERFRAAEGEIGGA
jgi:hypothetical protein